MTTMRSEQITRTVHDFVSSTAAINFERAQGVRSILQAVARLVEDRDVQRLCQHAILQADLVANDLDWLEESATKDFPNCKEETANA